MSRQAGNVVTSELLWDLKGPYFQGRMRQTNAGKTLAAAG
jgi:hypothetical protein